MGSGFFLKNANQIVRYTTEDETTIQDVPNAISTGKQMIILLISGLIQLVFIVNKYTNIGKMLKV